MDNGVKKLLGFIEKDEDAQEFLHLGLESYFEEFSEQYGLETIGAIEKRLGNHWMQLYPCALEFFFSNDYEKNYGAEKTRRWNVIDEFLRKRGMLLNHKNKEYLRSLKNSHMSIYEVIDIKPDHSLTIKDLVIGGKPIIVYEKSLTRFVEKWETMGLRICIEGGHNIIAGGALKLDREIALEVAEMLAEIHKMGMKELKKVNKELLDGATPSEIEHLLKVMWAKEIGLGYIQGIMENEEKLNNMCNSDGHKINYCTVEFPLNADRDDIIAKLQRIPDFAMEENTKRRSFWNWLEVGSNKRKTAKQKKEAESGRQQGILIDVTMQMPLLGNVRVLGTIAVNTKKLVAQANSKERANILEEKLTAVLGDMVGKASWKELPAEEIMKERGRNPVKSTKPVKIPKLDISPEEEAKILCEMMENYFMEWIDMPLPPLAGKTPRQAAKNAKTRKDAVELMKGFENNIKHLLRKKGASVDTGWMWKELGLEVAA